MTSSDALRQLDAFTTPGSLLRSGREARGITEREAADQLNLMPDYVGILERDDYQALRSPPFARGYVKAYGRLLEIDEAHLMQLFDEVNRKQPGQPPWRIETKPLQLQRTGMGVIIGLGVLLLLVLVLWWQLGGSDKTSVPPASAKLMPDSSHWSPGAER